MKRESTSAINWILFEPNPPTDPLCTANHAPTHTCYFDIPSPIEQRFCFRLLCTQYLALQHSHVKIKWILRQVFPSKYLIGLIRVESWWSRRFCFRQLALLPTVPCFMVCKVTLVFLFCCIHQEHSLSSNTKRSGQKEMGLSEKTETSSCSKQSLNVRSHHYCPVRKKMKQRISRKKIGQSAHNRFWKPVSWMGNTIYKIWSL